VTARKVSWAGPLVTVAMSTPVAATMAVSPTDWHTEGHDDASSEDDGSQDQLGEYSDVRHVVPRWSVVVRRKCSTALQQVSGHTVGEHGLQAARADD
jgi:hypothetical protein